MVEKGREDHGSGRPVPGICTRLFNFFTSFIAYYLHKTVILGATNFSESPSGAAEPFTGRRKGSIQATQDKGLINLELQRITPKISVANGHSGHARRHKATGQGVLPQGPNTSSNMGEGNCADIVIERGKWKVEGETSSSFASTVGHDKKRESTESVTPKKEKGARREKQEERRGIMKRPDAKKEVFDIDERSEHFIRQRRAAMRAGSDVEQPQA